MRTLRLVLLLLAAPAVFAQLQLRVYPPGPTSETPIRLGVITDCYYDARFAVEKTADAVVLEVTPAGPCPSPPFPILKYVEVGTLAPGTYRLRYRFTGSAELHEAGTIHVRNAHPPAPFEIHPFAVRSEPAGLQLRVHATGNLAVCGTADCSDVTITVGGVQARNVRKDPTGIVWFDAPPHAPGLVDVVIEKRQPAVTWTYPAALFYYSGPDLAAFERILFPVLFNALGANGSEWRSEAAISNPNPWFIENFNEFDPVVCITYPCGERLTPGSHKRINGGLWPQGIALLVPRPEAPGLAFGLRVRDVSRQAEGFGTEVPVVREEDMVLDKDITLLEVPLDPRYRVKLRVYAFDPPTPDQPAVKVVDPDTSALRATHHLTLTDCASINCAFTPGYAELDLPPGQEGERVSLYIDVPPGAPSWAFATVTNNDTQQVTVITPAGGSGQPCNPCLVP